MSTMTAQAVYDALEAAFRPWECTEVFPKVGLQVHNTDSIRQVYTATFVGDEVIRQLQERDASECMLFTHHPVPQRANPSDKPPAIPEEHWQILKERRITLFSYHIPLDRNGPYSPGNRLAQALGAEVWGSFYEQNQVTMGVLCTVPYQSPEELRAALEKTLGNDVALYDYGPETLPGGRLAIMAGGAKNHQIYQELREMGVHAFLTGVTNPQVPWVAENHTQARANGIHLFGGTHCATEKFAPMAMTQFFTQLGLPAEFLPETPHLNEL